MPTVKRRAIRDQSTKPNRDHLPDGIGGTITGGPMEPIDLMEILSRSARSVSRGGAVSGAAQTVDSETMDSGEEARADWINGQDLGIALSDGSRITFASIAAGVLREEDGRVFRQSHRNAGVEHSVRGHSGADNQLFADN
jgi:hypothetical protein